MNIKLSGKLAGPVIAAGICLLYVVLADIFSLPIYISVAVAVIGLIVIAALSASVNGSAAAYVSGAAEMVKNIAKGNFAPARSTGSDSEPDELFISLNSLSEGLKKFTDDISAAAKKYNGSIDERACEGAYREAAKNINALIAANAKDLDLYTQAVQNIAKGDFRNILPRQTDEKEKIYDAFEELASSTKNISTELNAAKKSAADSELSLKEIKNLSERMSRGDFNASGSFNFRGDDAEIFKALDLASLTVTNHNKELLAIFEEIARYTPGRSSARDYNGAFPQFKQAVNAAYGNIAGLSAAEAPKSVAKPGIAPRAVVAPKPAVSSAKPAAASAFTDASPSNKGNRLVKAPSAAKVYEAKDFGKY